MSSRFVSNRREIKYLVSIDQADDLRRRLKDVLVADPHDGGQGYLNYSVYFDSPELTFYKEKIEGLATRMKPRLRTYRTTFDDAPAAIFLEFKLREQHFIAKERTVLEAADAERLLTGDTVLDTSRTSGDAVIDKFAALARKMDLRPCAGIVYHRTAFSCSIQPGLRITFDKKLQCTARCDLAPPAEAFSPIEPFDRAVVELKYDAQPPEWILNVTAQMGLQQLSYSKYASGVERVHKIGRATVS